MPSEDDSSRIQPTDMFNEKSQTIGHHEEISITAGNVETESRLDIAKVNDV